MRRLLRRSFLFKRFKIKTRLTKQEVMKRIRDLSDIEYGIYYGRVTEHGFSVGERHTRSAAGIMTHNSFAPIARGTVVEDGDMTLISGIMRMHLLTIIFMAPIYLGFLSTVLLFPVLHIVMHFAFFKPAKRLQDTLEDALVEK